MPDKRNARARATLRQEQKLKIMEWYEETAWQLGLPPEPKAQIENESHGHVKTYTWYLEPLIPGVDNPMIEETSIGDSWGIEVKVKHHPIRSYRSIAK